MTITDHKSTVSGWQAEEQYLINQCTIVLDRVVERFPNGTLWVLNSERADIVP